MPVCVGAITRGTPEQPNGIDLFISALPSLMLFQVATRVEGAIDFQSGFGRCRAYQLELREESKKG
jgi:hypothetical protein